MSGLSFYWLLSRQRHDHCALIGWHPVIRWGESKGEQVRCSDLLEAQERETFDLTWQYTLLLSPLPSGEITSWTKTRQHHSLQVGRESGALTHGMSLTSLIGCFRDLFNIFIIRTKIIFWAQSSIIILMRSDITTSDSKGSLLYPRMEIFPVFVIWIAANAMMSKRPNINHILRFNLLRSLRYNKWCCLAGLSSTHLG